MGIFNEKIVTKDAMRFWSSSNKCNNARAILAFSKDEEDANKNLQLRGYKNILRKNIIKNNKGAIGDPTMRNVPYCTSGCTWGQCVFLGTDDFRVRWKLDKELKGTDSLTYFTHGDYLYISNSGTLTDKPSYFDKESIYRYEGVDVNGISISNVIDEPGTAFTKVSSTPQKGWDLTEAVEITDKNPIVPAKPFSPGVPLAEGGRWHDPKTWVDTDSWDE